MHLATFRISGSNIYGAVTGESAVDVELWCNDHCDLLHVEGERAVDALEPVRRTVGVRDFLEGDEEVVAITGDCLLERESGLVEDYAVANDCLLLPPLRYSDADKVVRLLALDHASLTNCFRDMQADGLTVAVESKREVETVTEERPMMAGRRPLSELTGRQRRVLETAVEAGYYELPRETTTEALADEMGLARRTTEEHLRRAEKKVIAGTVEVR